MRKWLNEWLFTGTTASAVLMSISSMNPQHPLSITARTLGYGLAALSISGAALVLWVRWRHERQRR